MFGEVLLFQNNGGPVGDRRHPRHTDFHGFGAIYRRKTEKAECTRAGQREFQIAHGFPPSFAGLACSRQASFSSRTKIVGGPTDFGKSALRDQIPAIRYRPCCQRQDGESLAADFMTAPGMASSAITYRRRSCRKGSST